jgi:hypothetical protein
MAWIFWTGIVGLLIGLASVPLESLLDKWEMYQRKRYKRFVERMSLMEQQREDEAPRDPMEPELRQVKPSREPPEEAQHEPWDREWGKRFADFQSTEREWGA